MTNSPPNIRAATASDLAAIDRFDLFAGERLLDIERGECFVTIEQEQVVGYIVFNHSFYLRPFVQFLCVHPDFRNRGHATQLLDYIAGICDGEMIFTSTESDNLIMLKLFNKKGYQVSGVVENIQERSEIIFCKKLKETS